MKIVSRRSGTLPAPLETLKIGKPIGKGGFAVVRSGQLRTADGTAFPVAIKILHPEYSDESTQELRLFKEEAELMLQLDHRNIITAYGLLTLEPTFPGLEGHTQPAYALVLEMMEGGSLARLMVKQLLAGAIPKYTFSQALGWLIDVARAIQYLHNGGKDGFPRIHRDVKLENVLLTAGMRTAKLADFGLQRAIFAQHPEGQQAMMIRRSMRPPAATLPLRPTVAHAGLSRLAQESDRNSQRSSAKLHLQVLPPAPSAPPGASEHGSSPIRLTPSSAHVERSGSRGPDTLSGSALFYAVDKNGLTPLVRPNSPQLQPVSFRSNTPTSSVLRNAAKDPSLMLQPQPCSLSGGVKEISRRSRSLSQLDQLSPGARNTALVAGASSARNRAVLMAPPPPPDVSNSQLRKATGPLRPRSSSSSSNNISFYKRRSSAFKQKSGLQLQLPPSPVSPAFPGGYSAAAGLSPRGAALTTADGCYSFSRPSPLGQSQSPSPHQPDGPTDMVSQFEERSVAAKSKLELASAGGCDSEEGAASARSPETRGSPKTPTAESFQVRLPEGNPCTPHSLSRTEATPGAVPPPSCFSAVNMECTIDKSSSSCVITQSPCAHDGGGPPGQSSAPALERAPPSRTSLQDVVLENGVSSLQPQLIVPAFTATSKLLQDLQIRSMRPLGSTAPGAFGGESGSLVNPTIAAGGSGRFKNLVADCHDSGNDAPGMIRTCFASGGTSNGLISGVLRPKQPSKSGSAVPRVAAECPVKTECMSDASLTTSALTTVVVSRAGSATVMAKAFNAAAEHEPVQRTGGILNGTSHAGNGKASVVLPPQLKSCHDSGGGGGNGSTNPPATGSISPECFISFSNTQNTQQEFLHMTDLLHLRLVQQNISVRSVRSSASGTLSRHMVVSTPSSPRLAAVGATTRAGGWQLDASIAPASVADVATAASGVLDGGVPSGGIKSIGAAADFEEVFSLTGRTGSLMYLAPEAYKNEPYNDKVDIYSLGILMYELFGRTSITYTHISTKLPAFSRMLCNANEFAERVAAGYRPPRTNQMMKMPPQLWDLIEASWHQDPVQRPVIGSVLAALEELVEPLAEADVSRRGVSHLLSQARCGCVIC